MTDAEAGFIIRVLVDYLADQENSRLMKGALEKVVEWLSVKRVVLNDEDYWQLFKKATRMLRNTKPD